MANKTANVNVHIEENVKKKVEGIPASAGINMFCRHYVSEGELQKLNDMTKDEFDFRMATGLAEAKAGKGILVEETFDQLTDSLVEKEAAN